MNKFEKYIRNPKLLVGALGARGVLNFISDETYIKWLFSARMGYKLDLEHPVTFNEKLQWLKLHDRKPEYTKMVDKYEVKKYIADIIGEKYIIPTLGVWNHFDEIDFDLLPNQFILKCTHDSGGLVIVKDKEKMNMRAAKKKIEKSLKHNYFYASREWPYKDVQPRIIAEKYMEDKQTHDLKDYKFFTFDGVVKAMFIATDRGSMEETKFDFYDADFNHLDFTNGHPNANTPIQKPKSFEEMKDLASRLSQNTTHLRVDFYEVDGKVYFGELTFAHWGGMVPFEPKEWDEIFGSWIKIP